MIKLAICGVCGKMGKRIAVLASRDREVSIATATEIKGCSLVGVKLGGELKTNDLGVLISDDLAASIEKCDCVIDFTLPEATMGNLEVALRYKKPIVIGTTGFSEPQVQEITAAAQRIPVLFAPNMSVSVNLIFDVVEKLTKSLGGRYKIRMEEVHHIHKKDKPSGTGKLIAGIIKNIRKDIDDVPIESIRQGEVVGDHRIIFDSEEDTIEVIHRAKTRDIFAIGAIQGAKYLAGKQAGLYGMKDVLEAL
ncbi:MAG: 4-hydroxy-tetrahydrodipicolinate reductase [Candidatus Omnitrophota bacterium]